MVIPNTDFEWVKTKNGSSKVTPYKNDNPLNGITTYDLVLISKHILGIEALGSPYKMIAADADRNGQIAASDVVEIRKLLLGIYTHFPNNTSWRFVPREHIFPNPLNPFLPAFPEIITVSSSALPLLNADFIGIKIGDVNNTVVASDCIGCNAFDRPLGSSQFSYPASAGLKAGQVITLPIRYDGTQPMIAWQGALRYDPAKLELIGPSAGDVPGLTSDNFHQPEPGEIRALWFAPVEAWETSALQPGQTLFQLSFRVRVDQAAQAELLSLSQVHLAGQSWTEDGSLYSLELNPSAAVESRTETEGHWVVCSPNPTQGALNFDIRAYPSAKRAQLLITDAFGRRMWQRRLDSLTPPYQVPVPEVETWPAGVYHWTLRVDDQREKGVFVKQ